MAQVVIREHNDMARPRGGGANVGTFTLKGTLVTDEYGLPIKVVDISSGLPVDSPRMTARTHFVAIEPDADVRYAIRPKKAAFTKLDATINHTPIPAGAVVIEAVYPGAIISFLQTSLVGGSDQAFQSSYVPVLGL